MGRLGQSNFLERLEKTVKSIAGKCYAYAKNTKSSFMHDALRQLFRSITSIGANCYEADSSISTREFRNKLSIALKEANESLYRIRIIHSLHAEVFDNKTIDELTQITKILTTIIGKLTHSKNL